MSEQQAAVDRDPSDPLEREAQTFPVISEEMADRIRSFGIEESLPIGAMVFERGQRGVDFFLVLDGAIEILDLADGGRHTVVTTHHTRQFTGELDLFNDRKIIVSGRAACDSRVVRIKRPDFRRLVTAEPDIAEIIMR